MDQAIGKCVCCGNADDLDNEGVCSECRYWEAGDRKMDEDQDR